MFSRVASPFLIFYLKFSKHFSSHQSVFSACDKYIYFIQHTVITLRSIPDGVIGIFL